MSQKAPNRRPQEKSKKPAIILLIIILVATIFANQIYRYLTNEQQELVSYDTFLNDIRSQAVKEAEISQEYIHYHRNSGDNIRYYAALIPGVDLDGVVEQLYRYGVTFRAITPENENGSFLFSWIIMPILLYAVFYFLLKAVTNKSAGFGGFGNVGKSKAKVYMERETGVTFQDVAGQDEAKESLVEIIDFLHNPKKYTAIGAKLPKGALLVGSPGTGKTLLAKAVAGEAHVPFFSISGSDFVEMFVGVGASRVRDLFHEASKVAPAMIFIDEIDAIGRSRDSRSGGNDEREQTLNQLLTEIDGFDSSRGVVILAATNRPEVLDKALLRAGRFDRRIIVDRPNLEGRYQTLLVHTRNIRLSDDVDLKKLAKSTAGAVGADLANLVNEAALRAVRFGRETVNQQDLLASFETLIAGAEKKGTVLTDAEKRIVAYHEVGHALIAALKKHTQPVSKITIVPHTSGALGYTLQMPEEEKYLQTKEEFLIQLQTLLGGRAAEEVVFGIQTSGAANDIQKATELAKKMVMQLGMGDKIGLMALSTQGNEYLEAQGRPNCSQATASEADKEVRAILNRCYEDAKYLLSKRRTLLNEIALYLLQKETITGDELMHYVRLSESEEL